MRDRLKADAERHNRSTNAEIVARLEESLDRGTIDDLQQHAWQLEAALEKAQVRIDEWKGEAEEWKAKAKAAAQEAENSANAGWMMAGLKSDEASELAAKTKTVADALVTFARLLASGDVHLLQELVEMASPDDKPTIAKPGSIPTAQEARPIAEKVIEERAQRKTSSKSHSKLQGPPKN